METDDRLRYGRCWWCGEADSLFRLEGARLAGSPPMPLPSTLVTEEERDAFRVCPRCAVVFGWLRHLRDLELAEIGPTLVWSRVRKAIEDDHAKGE